MKRNALVLGGTEPHIALIQKLKNRGYHTILIDWLDAPIARRFAEEHLRISTLALTEVMRVAVERKALLVVSANIDQANVTASFISEKLGLPKLYDYETALNVTDKSRMKRIMDRAGIMMPAYMSVGSYDDAAEKIEMFPVVIKPSDSKGSRGVRLCNNEDDLRRWFDDTWLESRSRRVIVEQYIDGQEYSFYYWIEKDVPRLLTGGQRYPTGLGNQYVLQSTGTVFPIMHNSEMYNKAKKIAEQVTDAFSIHNGPLFIQAIEKDGDLFVLEFGARIGGGLSGRALHDYASFDYQENYLRLLLNETLDLSLCIPEYYFGSLFIYAPGCVFGAIEGAEQLISDGIADSFHQSKSKLDRTTEDMSSGSRVGGFLLHADNMSDYIEKVKYINRSIEVYDVNGNKCMNHDAYNIWRNL